MKGYNMLQLLRMLQRCKCHTSLIAAVLLMMLALGCSKKADLVGIWQNTSVQESIEFRSDNSGIIQGKQMPPLIFTWKETAKNSYNLEVDFQGQKRGLKALVQDGTMVLEGEQGKESYRKVSPK